ncbi:hypothetical protein JCM9279_003701 [Rhodotorula babjevae]
MASASTSAAASRSSPPPPRVAFLGPLGTYSHQATTDFFGGECDLVPQPRIADVFTAVSTGETAFGVVPIENSSFGQVVETMDQLRATELSVRGTTALRIGHALLASKRAEKGQVKRVYSHEQGIGQCRSYLAQRYPDVAIVPVNSTAQAAREAANDVEGLAICSLKCAEVYGLAVVDTDIQDAGATNTTRFIVLAPSTVPLPLSYPASRPVERDEELEQ